MPHEDLQELQRLWKKAEDKLKEVERISEGVVIPSVNELRYAGYHLLKYLRDGSKEDLTKAQSHCQRALFDSHEFHIGLNLARIHKFEDDYRVVEVSPVIQNYPDLQVTAETARTFLATHSKGEHSSKEDHYEEAEAHALKLEAVNATLTAARPEMNKKLRNRGTDSRRFITILGVGILTLLAAILTILATHYWPPSAN